MWRRGGGGDVHPWYVFTFVRRRRLCPLLGNLVDQLWDHLHSTTFLGSVSEGTSESVAQIRAEVYRCSGAGGRGRRSRPSPSFLAPMAGESLNWPAEAGDEEFARAGGVSNDRDHAFVEAGGIHELSGYN